MPEEELRAFLRVFVPQEQIEAALDTVALLGLEAEVTEPLELFAIAHLEVARDPRVTRELEAVVLVEEAGLTEADAAVVLGMSEEEVQAVVAAAWEGLAPAAEPEVPEPEVPSDGGGTPDAVSSPQPTSSGADPTEAAPPVGETAELVAMPVPGDDADRPASGAPVEASGAPVEVEASGAPVVVEAPPVRVARRSPLRWLLGAGAAIVLIAVLGIAAFSAAGQQRLRLLGLDPLVLVGLMMLLIVGGLALARAGSEEGFTDQPLEGSAEEPPAAGQQGHDADEQDREDHQAEGDEGGVAEAGELERLVEDVER